MERYGTELEFLGKINSKGTEITPVPDELIQSVKNDKFNLTRLSITDKTYIASNFHTFIVMLKNEPNL